MSNTCKKDMNYTVVYVYCCHQTTTQGMYIQAVFVIEHNRQLRMGCNLYNKKYMYRLQFIQQEMYVQAHHQIVMYITVSVHNLYHHHHVPCQTAEVFMSLHRSWYLVLWINDIPSCLCLSHITDLSSCHMFTRIT